MPEQSNPVSLKEAMDVVLNSIPIVHSTIFAHNQHLYTAIEALAIALNNVVDLIQRFNDELTVLNSLGSRVSQNDANYCRNQISALREALERFCNTAKTMPINLALPKVQADL